MRDILVVYHASCMDGFASAWAAWHWLVKSEWDNINFLPADYDDPIPEMTGKEVYVLDYSWKQVDEFLTSATSAKKVVIIDHHVEANKIWSDVALPSHIHYVYDVKHSGCVLSWDYFQQMWLQEQAKKGHLLNIQGTPEVLRNIEDRDLWKFDLPYAREMHAYLKSCGFLLREKDTGKIIDQFIKFHNFYSMDHAEYNRFVENGRAILYSEEVLIKSILERNMSWAVFETHEPGGGLDWLQTSQYRIPVAEMPYELASEAGNILCNLFPEAHFSLTYETQWKYNRRKFSLRSRKNGGADVGAIATLMGGGGHKTSSGWYQDIREEFPFKV